MTTPSAQPRSLEILDRATGRDALLAFVSVAVLVTVLIQINVTLPGIGHLGGALVAVTFLYATVFFAWRRHEDLDAYGFHVAPRNRGLAIAGVVFAVVFPVFVAGYITFYELLCSSELRGIMRSQCAGFHGLDGVHAPLVSILEARAKNTFSLEFCAVQLVVVAVPEELFFRGFLLGLLERRFPPTRRWLGGGVGLALVLSSLAFALVHVPKAGNPLDLATFFPGLMFGWMRSATGSILASTLTHAGSNVLVRLLDLMVLR